MAVIIVMLTVIMVHLELEEGAERRAPGLWQRKQVLCRRENYDSQGITKTEETEEKTPNSFVEMQMRLSANILLTLNDAKNHYWILCGVIKKYAA